MNPDERNSKLTLVSVFLAVFLGFCGLLRRRDEEVELGPFDLALLGLSTYRTGRLLAFERVAAPLRAPFTTTKRDASGTGEAVVATGSGWRWTLGELLSCPVCIGTWAAAGLVYARQLAPRPTRAFLAVMASTGVAQLLGETTEALEWSGRSARKAAAPIRDV